MTKDFLPGAHYHFLTPLYETLVRPAASGIWRNVARQVSSEAPNNGTVIDIGCGPGSTLRMIHTLRPDLALTGVDIDPAMIAIARKKSLRMGITFLEASADAIPLSDTSADIFMSTFAFHHLNTSTKQGTFREVRRILKPHGRFLLCDLSREKGARIRWPIDLLARFEHEILPQLHGQLEELGRAEGFTPQTLWTRYGCASLHVFSLP